MIQDLLTRVHDKHTVYDQACTQTTSLDVEDIVVFGPAHRARLLGPCASRSKPSAETLHFRCSAAPPGSVPSIDEQRAGVKRVHMIAGVSVSSARARFQRLRARSQRSECRGAGSSEEPLLASPLSGAPCSNGAGLHLILFSFLFLAKNAEFFATSSILFGGLPTDRNRR